MALDAPVQPVSDEVDENTSRTMEVRWRDNRGTDWSKTHYIDLGKVGVRKPIYNIRRLGVYRTRCYELILNAAMEHAIVQVEEEVEVLV